MIDSNQIFNAIVAANYSSVATEQGSELVDCWIENCEVEDRARYKTLLIEAGFFIQLDAETYVVGTCDRVMRDDEGVLVEEMKTTSSSRTWTAERWFEQISRSHQVGTYGAALARGYFLNPIKQPTDLIKFSSQYIDGVYNPNWNGEERLLVRAVTKSRPPEIWPTPAGALVTVDERRIETTLNAYRNAAAAIRAMRGTQLLPWQLPQDQHCNKVFGYKTYPCNFRQECDEGRWEAEVARGQADHGLSPGSEKVREYLIASSRISPRDPNVVLLSASSLDDWQQCPERWRRRSLGQPRESKESLEIGTVFHIGMREFHFQLMQQGF